MREEDGILTVRNFKGEEQELTGVDEKVYICSRLPKGQQVYIIDEDTLYERKSFVLNEFV